MNSLVLDNPNEFVEHINYAHKILNSSDGKLRYSLNLNLESGLETHEGKMKYLNQYVSIPEIRNLIKLTEQKVNEFRSSKGIDSEPD